MKITLESTDLDCYLITAEDGRDKLIQSDCDYPGIASTFGWKVSDLINKKIRMLKFNGGGFEKERFKPNKLSQFDTPTSAAFKRFAEKIKKEL
jgi:hypothetical protein